MQRLPEKMQERGQMVRSLLNNLAKSASLLHLSVQKVESEPAFHPIALIRFKFGMGWVEDTALRVHLRHFVAQNIVLSKDALNSRDTAVSV